MRLDKYLKVSRLIKRRTVANDACDADRILVNGRQAKASYRDRLWAAHLEGGGHPGLRQRLQGRRPGHVQGACITKHPRSDGPGVLFVYARFSLFLRKYRVMK